MDLNARVDVNCGRKDRRTDGLTENRTPISHLAEASATKTKHFVSHSRPNSGYESKRGNRNRENGLLSDIDMTRLSNNLDHCEKICFK